MLPCIIAALVRVGCVYAFVPAVQPTVSIGRHGATSRARMLTSHPTSSLTRLPLVVTRYVRSPAGIYMSHSDSISTRDSRHNSGNSGSDRYTVHDRRHVRQPGSRYSRISCQAQPEDASSPAAMAGNDKIVDTKNVNDDRSTSTSTPKADQQSDGELIGKMSSRLADSFPSLTDEEIKTETRKLLDAEGEGTDGQKASGGAAAAEKVLPGSYVFGRC